MTRHVHAAGTTDRPWRRPLCRATVVAATFFITLTGPAACTRDATPEVVLYVSADEYVARQVVAVFEERSGIRVRFVGDTEARKTTGLVERLRAERNRPRADVFWSSEIFMTISLADEGILAPMAPANGGDRPAAFRDDEGRWFGFASRARVIVYAPDRVPADDVPRRWMDLADSTWRGRIAIADPRFGTTGGHLGAMMAAWDAAGAADRFDRFIEGLASNETRVTPAGNAGVVRLVAEGEADLGLTDTDDVWAAIANGATVGLVYPDHLDGAGSGGGTLLIPNTVARVAGGPNPEAAAALVEFLLSADVERMLFESDSHNVPARSDVAVGDPRFVVPDPLEVDYRAAARARHAAVDRAVRLLIDRGAVRGTPDAS